ncbi:hemolysin family protein [Deinococcus sp. Marseille-Q6407]|uniref:hemolysin family protein n=1 Tax=Deinococcus sp. Marseille-Q6407 TaxID=2969223 RepID=UPI0021BF9164|nr:hemolysin family protein [Deinococcus sp. Marseille-Q6407]
MSALLTYLVPVLVILALIVLNGLFVTAEFSLVSSRRSRIAVMAEAGNPAANRMLEVFDQPTGKDQYVAVAQLGITLASIGLGMYGEQQVAGWLYHPLEQGGLTEAGAHTVATVISLSLITFMHVVFGEMIPKALALQGPEQISLRIYPMMKVFSFVFRPLVILLNWIALGMMHLLGIKDPGDNASLYTSKELSILTEESTEGGQLAEEQRDLIQNIFALEERTAEELMTPRTRIEAISVDTGPEEISDLIVRSPRSRYPVYDGSLDQVVGVLLAKDFIRARVRGYVPPLPQLVRRLASVSAHAPAEDLLTLFKRERMHAALVVDEYGGTMGLVTLDDLIDDVIEDDDPLTSDWVRVQSDGSLLLDGEVTLSELCEDYAIQIESEEATTIAGVLLEQHGTLPSVGSAISLPGYDLQAEEVQGLKITRVLLRPRPEENVEMPAE